MELSLDYTINFRSFQAIGNYVLDSIKKIAVPDHYIHGVKATNLAVEILKEFGRFGNIVKDFQASLKFPIALTLPANIVTIPKLVSNFYRSVRFGDAETVAHSGFSLYALNVDIAEDLQSISNALSQLFKMPELRYEFATSVVYPLIMVSLIVSAIIEVKNMIKLKAMTYSRQYIVIASNSKMNYDDLRNSVIDLLEKRMNATCEEQQKIDQEQDVEKRKEKYSNLTEQKENKLVRLGGKRTHLLFQELNSCVDGSKRYSSQEVRKILSKINMSYNYEMKVKVQNVVKLVLKIVGVLVLIHTPLVAVGCILLISAYLLAIYIHKDSKDFQKKLDNL